MHNAHDVNARKRYGAILIGCAIGDTLGMPVEGWKREQIKKYAGNIERPIDKFKVYDNDGTLKKKDRFGKIKYYNMNLRAGQFTDDTILTLALAESLVNKGLDLKDAAKKQLKYYHNYHDRGYGKTTQEAFANLEKKISPENSGIIGGPGNGPAMKMSPLGIYMHATEKYFDGLKYAVQIAKMTHLDPRSVVSGIIQADSIYGLLRGIDREEFIEGAFNISSMEVQATKNFPKHKVTMQEKFLWIKNNSYASDEKAFKHLKNSSLVWESHPFTVFMFQKYWDDPIKGLLKTVNYGGDCDTTGAIFGALIGARHGMIFPKEWIDIIEDKKKILELAKKMENLRGGSK